MFNSASDASFNEWIEREKSRGEMLSFGVDFLDDALRGICIDDLILLGAPSGVGKTQLCCNIAISNLEAGKKVHYIALEAATNEIERRLKYPLVAERYFSDHNRPFVDGGLNYSDWYMGKYAGTLTEYEQGAAEFFKSAYRDLFIFSKDDKFGVKELVKTVLYCAEDTDLIIIDHVHYFDFDDDNENRALKEIAKTVRTLALEEQVPIILVAHLRKRDRQNDELCPGLDEFHGSSDLFKIATKVITFSPGKPTLDGRYETFFRIPKNRLDGGVSRFLGKEIFNPKRGGYDGQSYQVGWSEQKRSSGFQAIDFAQVPSWARRRDKGSDHLPSPRDTGYPILGKNKRAVPGMPYKDSWE